MPYDQTMPVPNQNPQVQRQGTNAPAPMNPTPTTPFVQQPQAARQPKWQGPPTDTGLPQGPQQQPSQPGAVGQPPQQPNNNPQAPQMVGQWQPSTAGGGSGVGYANGAPLLGGGSNIGGGPNVTQGSPQYQGFENGFQPQGEWGNAMGTPGGGGPNSMTLEGVPGYGGNNAGGGGGGAGGPGGGGGTGGDWGGYGNFSAAMSGDTMQQDKYNWSGGDPALNDMISQIDWSSIPGINTADDKRNAIEQFMTTGIHPVTGQFAGGGDYWANAPGQ